MAQKDESEAQTDLVKRLSQQTLTNDVCSKTTSNYTDICVTRIVDISDLRCQDIYDVAKCEQSDKIYVTGLCKDTSERCVFVYDSALNYINRFETHGHDSQNLPFVHVNDSGDLLVTHYWESGILLMDQSGHCLRNIHTSGRCAGISSDHDGNTYVGLKPRGTSFILKMTSDGEFIMKIGEQKEMTPLFLFLKKDRLYVSDFIAKSLFVFNIYTGDCVMEVDGMEINDDPAGVCVDDSDRIFWCDKYKHCIHVYDTDGSHVTTIEDGNLRRPGGLTFLPTGELLVVSRDNKKLIVFNQKSSD